MKLASAVVLSCVAGLAGAADLEIRLDEPRDGEVIADAVQVRGSAEGAVEVWVQIDEEEPKLANGTDEWTKRIDFSKFEHGPHTVRARARDAGGREKRRSAAIVVGQSPPPPSCEEVEPGQRLPYVNPSAPATIDVSDWGRTVAIEIIGHSENRGYDVPLQRLLDEAPIAGKRWRVTNRWIGSEETWQWTTPGEAGYEAVETLLADLEHPTIALVLTSNNSSFPIHHPDDSDPHFKKFVKETQALADHLWADGAGAKVVFFTSHRFKPTNLWPTYYERIALGQTMAAAGRREKEFIQSGPELFDLSWCSYPDTYDADLVHTNEAGDEMLALAWYRLLASVIQE